jgi:Na+-driven multidrug efflux pump
MGVMVLCGQKIGRGETDDIKQTTFFAVAMCTALMAAVCLVLFIFFNPIIGLYNVEPATYRYIRQLMFSVFVAQILFWSFAFITPATLRAAGDVKYTMVASIISMWVFRIILGYVFAIAMGLGIIGVWLGMYVDWIVRGILFNGRLLNGKWMGKGIKD